MNNLKSIILDYLAAKKSGILDTEFSAIQSLYLEGNALQTSYRVQHVQG